MIIRLFIAVLVNECFFGRGQYTKADGMIAYLVTDRPKAGVMIAHLLTDRALSTDGSHFVLIDLHSNFAAALMVS
jgi:hypothetical protein